MNLAQVEFFKKSKVILDVLKRDDIELNCNICPSRNKLTDQVDFKDFNAPLLFDKIIQRCMYCFVSVAKRKIAYQFIKEYFDKFDKKFFTIRNIKKYISDVYEHHEVVNTSVRIVIRDMLDYGIIKVDRRRSSGIRYQLINDDLDSISEEAKKKAFGHLQGIKKKNEVEA